MYLVFLDTETSGLNPEKHRAIEIAYRVADTSTGQFVLRYETLITQTAEVWAEADKGSLQVHGLTWEDLLQGKTERFVAEEIVSDMDHLKLGTKGGVFICQNPSFDRIFFNQLINTELQEHLGWPYHWLDLASMYWAARHLQSPQDVKTIKESDLSKNQIASHYGIAPESLPHRAMNGVNHLIACYEALFGKFETHLRA